MNHLSAEKIAESIGLLIFPELTTKQSKALVLATFCGNLSAANYLGVSVNTVKTTVLISKKKLTVESGLTDKKEDISLLIMSRFFDEIY